MTPDTLEPPVALLAPRLIRRMACWLYEGLLLFGVVFITDYSFSTLTQTRHALDHRHAQQLLLFLVIGLYFTWFGEKGQTLAMKTWHIRVVDAQGLPLTKPRAFLRYVLSWVWFLPPLLMAWALEMPVIQVLGYVFLWILLWAASSHIRSDKQFWHDVWAGTRLVSATSPSLSSDQND